MPNNQKKTGMQDQKRQEALDREESATAGYNRRGSKDSQLR